MTAYECVRDLIGKYSERDPFELAEAEGICLRFKNLGSLQGLYFFAEERAFILINEGLCEEKQRMICAHELGHHFLHRDLSGTVFSETALFDMTGRPEIEANLFAAELLLTDEEVLSSGEEYDFYAMASILNVYPEFLLFKLRSMNQRGFCIPLPEECKNSFWNKH